MALGCAGVAALMLLAAIGVGVLGAIEARRPAELASLDRTHPRSADPELLAAGAPAAGRIVLDLDMLEFAIEPGEPGSEIRLVGGYDRSGYELVESYERAPDGGFTYRLRFKPTGLINRFVYSNERGAALTLIVPPDHPLTLEGRVGKGGSELELGGLWLVESELELGAGSHAIAFSAPLREPMQRLRLDSDFGEVQIRRLGNASPRRLEIDKFIGSTDLDLGGAWREDGSLWVGCGVGRCNVAPPHAEEAALQIGEIEFFIGDSTANVYRRSQPEPLLGKPRLTLDIEGIIGESIDIER